MQHLPDKTAFCMSENEQEVPVMFNTTERVSALMKERGLSAAELATLSGLNASTLRVAFARGSQLSVRTVEQICDALGITLREFFTESEKEAE